MDKIVNIAIRVVGFLIIALPSSSVAYIITVLLLLIGAPLWASIVVAFCTAFALFIFLENVLRKVTDRD